MRSFLRTLCVLLLPLACVAHVNSPDVYYDGYAGPYHLLVTLRPPAVVPGVAQVQVRTFGSDVQEIKILPLRMIGVGAKMAPLPETTKRSAGDPLTTMKSTGPPGLSSSKTPIVSRPVRQASVSRLVRPVYKSGPSGKLSWP